MENTAHVLAHANDLYTRAAAPPPTTDTRPPVYKAIGISLAIASGLFIGISFVLKKVGLLKANVKYNEEAGEGYGYLKNAFWWSGMTLMIIGEICNFVAYAFVDAILVTPLGALSVVITTILSAIFLKERLSFVGKIGCFLCIIGSVVIVMNAPGQSSAATIQDMQHFVIAPGFLTYAGIIIIGCAFIAFWVGPRYGKKSMLVYLSVCSLIGGLSVVATQGLGAAVVKQASGTPQFNQWFLYVLFVFVIATLVTEIIFLNKALNIFNAALVTPTYYVFFTSATIVTSAILFRGFKGTPTSIITVVLGFLVICSGVILLQLSKSAKDVPDTAVFTGDLDQVRTVAEQAEPESEPKADAIRGAAAIVRRFSQSRQKMEAAEAKRVHEERMKDQMEPIGENEQVEWDGLRRRKTVIDGPPGSLRRRKTLHPPLGMTHFPDEDELSDSRPASADIHGGEGFHRGFFNSFRQRGEGTRRPAHSKSLVARPPPTDAQIPMPQRPLTEIVVSTKNGEDTAYHPPSQDGAMEMGHVYGLPTALHGGDAHLTPPTSQHGTTPASRSSLAPTPPPHAAKRQFSFQNVFHRHRTENVSSDPQIPRPTSRRGLGSRQGSKEHSRLPGLKTATEEERLGLVTGDSTNMLPFSPREDPSDEDDWQLEDKPFSSSTQGATSHIPLIREEKESESGSSSDVGERADKSTPRVGTTDEEGRRWKEWEGGSGGGGGGGGGRGAGGSTRGGPAFI